MQQESIDGCEVDSYVLSVALRFVFFDCIWHVPYSGWLAACEKHINREYLIPAAILRLSDPESKTK